MKEGELESEGEKERKKERGRQKARGKETERKRPELVQFINSLVNELSG